MRILRNPLGDAKAVNGGGHDAACVSGPFASRINTNVFNHAHIPGTQAVATGGTYFKMRANTVYYVRVKAYRKLGGKTYATWSAAAKCRTSK